MKFILFLLAAGFFSVPALAAKPSALLATDLTVYDDRFYQWIDASSKVEVLIDNLGWAEGPVWSGALNALLFSDLAADRIYRWDERHGKALYLSPSGHEPDDFAPAWRGSNGLAIDSRANLYLAQQGSRRLSRMLAPVSDPAPKYQVLASHYQGKSINSPNDLTIHPSGDIYFTDPPYGLDGFENSAAIELDFFGVFRLTPQGELSTVKMDLEKPNGIALSPDFMTLYVSNSESDQPGIFAIKLDPHGNPGRSRLFYDARHLVADGPGSTDGLAVHRNGNLFISIPNGLAILSADGEILGKLALGQVTNLAFDSQFRQLYITTPKRLLRIGIKPFN